MQKVAYRREEAIIIEREVAEGEGEGNKGEGGENKEGGDTFKKDSLFYTEIMAESNNKKSYTR